MASPSPKCSPEFTFKHVNINYQLHNTKPSRQPPEPFRIKSPFHTPSKHSILLSLSHLNINQHRHTIPDSTHVTHPPNRSVPISASTPHTSTPTITSTFASTHFKRNLHQSHHHSLSPHVNIKRQPPPHHIFTSTTISKSKLIPPAHTTRSQFNSINDGIGTRPMFSWDSRLLWTSERCPAIVYNVNLQSQRTSTAGASPLSTALIFHTLYGNVRSW